MFKFLRRISQLESDVREVRELLDKHVQYINNQQVPTVKVLPSEKPKTLPLAPVPSGRLSKKAIKEMRDYRRSGFPAGEIAKAFGVSSGAVSYHTADLSPRSYKQVDLDTRRKIGDLRSRGMTQNQVMAELGLSKKVVQRYDPYRDKRPNLSQLRQRSS